MIDTDYTSLNEIDSEIVRFYSEDVRTKTIGYTDDEEPKPMTEEYTVIVLNKPNIVAYDYVESRRGRRLSDSVINQAMKDAIAWEDFHINHDGYLNWRESYEVWKASRPTEIVNGEEVAIPAPIRPVIDMSNRRAVYKTIHEAHERDKWYPSSGVVENIDDDSYTVTLQSLGASDSDWAEFLANPSPEYIKHLKMVGVEFEGVMCSACKEDMYGLDAVREWITSGQTVNFEFDNGNVLTLTPDNIDAFEEVWVPFRAGFF